MKITNDFLKNLIKEGLTVKLGKKEIEEETTYGSRLGTSIRTGGAAGGLLDNDQSLTGFADPATIAPTAPAAPTAPTAAPAKKISMANMFTGPQFTPAAAGSKMHTIKRGETLSKIAKQYGTTVQALASSNGIRNVNALKAGAQLVIPTSVATSAPAVPAVPAAVAGEKNALAPSQIADQVTNKVKDQLSGYVSSDDLRETTIDLENLINTYGVNAIKQVDSNLKNDPEFADGLIRAIDRVRAFSVTGESDTAKSRDALINFLKQKGLQEGKNKMSNTIRVNTNYLKQIIQEELQSFLNEQEPTDADVQLATLDTTPVAGEGEFGKELPPDSAPAPVPKPKTKKMLPIQPVVGEIQKMLVQTGYLPNEAKSVDQRFGMQTRSAMIKAYETMINHYKLFQKTPQTEGMLNYLQQELSNLSLKNKPSSFERAKGDIEFLVRYANNFGRLPKQLATATMAGADTRMSPEEFRGGINVPGVQRNLQMPDTQVRGKYTGPLKSTVPPTMDMDNLQSVPMAENKVRFSKSYVQQVIKEETSKFLNKKKI